MKTTLPKRNFKQIFLLSLLFLFSGIISGYGQTSDTFDGNYCPLPGTLGDEYDSSQVNVFTQIVNSNYTGTCAVEQIWAKVNTDDENLRIAFKIGNGGTALFRLYLDTDGDPDNNLTEDHFGGQTFSVSGAEYVLQINSNSNYALFEVQPDLSLLDVTADFVGEFEGLNGNSDACSGKGDNAFMEFFISM